ncbi:MAG: C25 family cysteine peptidase [Phycisphaerales bacterium]|nr:C25 family cysteine peptidase [Phycisphaerales bacterium]
MKSYQTNAQYGNEWIDYSKTYWKFKVGTEGIFRISKSTLDAIGIPSGANGKDFVLYRDGKEITLYTTTNGVLGIGDYIEFFATANDGQLDKELYITADKHANPNASLFYDTATYFLTLDNLNAHLRYTEITTPIPSIPPSPLSYCWATVMNNTRGAFSEGKTNAPVQIDYGGIKELYSSQFDQGEGFLIGWNASINPANISIATPNFVSGSMNARLKTASIAESRDSIHRLKLYFNGLLKADETYGKSDIKHFDLSIPSTELSNANTLNFSHYYTGIADIFGLPYWQLEYPRDWNFNGLDYSTFKVSASTNAQYIEINNFNHGGVAPRLYDITNNKWYAGNISVLGKTRFYIDASLKDMNMVLYAATSPKIFNLTTAQQRLFTDYNNTENQGNYMIISHKNLMRAVGGKNYIQEYKNYRSSVAGGGYTVTVADIEELYDQFAYGINTHPSSIRRFIDFGLSKWTTKPKYVFLIGKGVTYEYYRNFIASSSAGNFEGIVPTYGSPGSDIAFVTDRENWKMKLNIGRLSAWNTDEVRDYLNKIKSYEAALTPSPFPTPTTELWKKQVLHIAGGDGPNLDLQTLTLLPGLNSGKVLIEQPNTGGVVTTIAKSTKGLPTTTQDKKIDSLISSGLSLITYYGHGSAFALDYNIKEPSEFNSAPRLPIFSAFGCDISSIYKTDTAKTITERFIAAPVSGAIVAIASNNLGYVHIHSRYIPTLYSAIAQESYGQTIGDQFRTANDNFMASSPPTAYSTSLEQTHMESLILQGDPASKSSFSAPKPDYYVGPETVATIPSTITTSLDSFQLRVTTYNLGRAITDTIQVKIEHTNPSGKLSLTKTYQIIKLNNTNTITVKLPIDKIKDLGINKYKITVDYDGHYDELSEANNTTTLEVFVLSDNIVPIYPFDFSIVYNNDLTLKASTLNPFKELRKYRFEMDTTELFNSPLKLQTIISGSGGVVKWKPNIVLQDSMVYYWRTSIDSSLSGGNFIWQNSSFVYLKNGSAGWNQSHYYQYKYNNMEGSIYDESRRFSYGKLNVLLQVKNTITGLSSPYTKYDNPDYNKVLRNGNDLQRYDCYPPISIQIMVFDTTLGNAWANPPGGMSGSKPSCPPLFARNINCFSFNLNTAASRNNARKFLDSIPNGYYILIKNCIAYNIWENYFVDTWKSDTATYGSGKSLYHSMRNLGFNRIDSFYQTRAFSMICKKGATDYPVQQNFATGINDILDTTYVIPISDVSGNMNSVVVGPASNWKTLKWRTSLFVDTFSSADSSSVKITGIDKFNNEAFLYEGPARDTNLNFINATNYPKLKLKWYSRDTLYHTSPQLDYWRILYDPLPEAALNPSAYYAFTDSLNVGQMMNLETTVETLTELPMDSMLVRYKVIDANGVNHLLADKKYRKLSGNDTLHIGVSFDPKSYPGKNFLFIEANPDNTQPEQYHPNNLGYIPFTIKSDVHNPVLDVTFDGTHILDKDIVSAKPFIKVLLRDENKYLALNDTSSMQLSIRYPSDAINTKRTINFDGSTCKFVPADMSAGKNEAFIEYRPNFTEDGIYQLFAKGKDVSGNDAGASQEYSISFEVVNKSTISNLVNYPNPFSTSTAFVFTITGWQLPSQFKIQILSVSGKVVREITKQELGNIHIGRNITEYKWDGKDQYGQLLGNGVYLYRVVTSINGDDIEHRNSGVDKFYKNGFSKMYIMR